MSICDVCGTNFTSGFEAPYGDEVKHACSTACCTTLAKSLPFDGHALESYSRVTGYLQNIDGWNPGKRAELKDRYRSVV